MVSRVITATMLFLQFILYSSSFAGTLKIEIPGAALELCQLKLKQFSPDILKFSTKHEDNPLTSNYLWFLAYVCLYLMQACVDWVLITFRTQVIKKKRPVRSVFLDYLSVSYDYVRIDYCIRLQNVHFHILIRKNIGKMASRYGNH